MATVTGKVTRTSCKGATYYGNPMMEAYIEATDENDSGWYRVSNDAGLNYGIANSEYRDNNHTFELTRAGRLSGRATLAN